jgi:hypothetical protein
MTHRTIGRLVLVAALTSAGLVAATTLAQADFHLMEVQEVSAGTTAQPNADFVELEMTEALQGNVSGHRLLLFDAAGNRMDCTLPADVANEANGAPVLFGTTEFQALPSTADPDFIVPPLLHADGGAVCWESIDCVSWGSFSGSTTSPAGTPEGEGIPPDQSINRVADTNNSDPDFTAGAPTPVANGAPRGATTCGPPGQGPSGGGSGASLQGLKAKVRGNKAAVRGKIQPPAPGQKVSLTFFANGSPLRKIAKKAATLNAESRFRKTFRIPADSTRCRVRVAFQGDPMGKKTFRC